jgi:hypothetical protein
MEKILWSDCGLSRVYVDGKTVYDSYDFKGDWSGFDENVNVVEQNDIVVEKCIVLKVNLVRSKHTSLLVKDNADNEFNTTVNTKRSKYKVGDVVDVIFEPYKKRSSSFRRKNYVGRMQDVVYYVECELAVRRVYQVYSLERCRAARLWAKSLGWGERDVIDEFTLCMLQEFPGYIPTKLRLMCEKGYNSKWFANTMSNYLCSWLCHAGRKNIKNGGYGKSFDELTGEELVKLELYEASIESRKIF